MEQEITIKEFVELLWENCRSKKDDGDRVKSAERQNLLRYGHLRGWLEDQDEVMADSFLEKRTCARILHQFMKIELIIPDCDDVKDAFSLKDIYTCRVCTNHVAQIYGRGIMEGEELEINGQSGLFFNMTRLLTKEEVFEAIKKVRKLVN